MDDMTNGNLPQINTRRDFLKTTAALALAHSALGRAQGSTSDARNGKILAYVGTYTGSSDGGSNGEGIYLFDVDAHTGELSNRRLVAKTPNPSWLAIHPSKKYLYAINEVTDFQGHSGSVSAFAIDAASGGLTHLNTVSSEGAGPAHMSLDAAGRFAFVANYAGGTIAVLPIHAGGSLGSAVDIHHDTGSVGAKHATSAPPGSFAISGHDAPHAHMISADPQNKFVLSTDLGQDRIYVYRFDSASGKLTPSSGTPVVHLPTGDGPRHFAFHPNGHWLYTLQEEASTIAFFHYDPASGSLSVQQTISSLPAGFAGTNFGSEIHVSQDGKFLYAANRLHNSIAICAIESSGRLRHIGEAASMGDYPRNFAIGPTHDFLYACDQRSDCITLFRVNRGTGMLSFTGHYTPVGTPAMITFLV
jgi:6-phosphogluconolactonase (cycloisomerase 2 family)